MLQIGNSSVASESILPPDSGLPLEFDPSVRTLAAVDTGAGHLEQDPAGDLQNDLKSAFKTTDAFNSNDKSPNGFDEVQPRDFDADQPYQTTSFGLADITALLQNGHAEIALPNGRHVALTKESAWQQQDMHRVRFLADGLVGTITVSTRDQDQQFFATIATRDDVFRLQGRLEQDTRIFSHRLLAQRTSPHIEDFRHVPHPSHHRHDATSTL
ncbi:MAG: hypothetical protein AAF993_10445 [Pseudomonadota bacterium]